MIGEHGYGPQLPPRIPCDEIEICESPWLYRTPRSASNLCAEAASRPAEQSQGFSAGSQHPPRAPQNISNPVTRWRPGFQEFRTTPSPSSGIRGYCGLASQPARYPEPHGLCVRLRRFSRVAAVSEYVRSSNVDGAILPSLPIEPTNPLTRPSSPPPSSPCASLIAPRSYRPRATRVLLYSSIHPIYSPRRQSHSHISFLESCFLLGLQRARQRQNRRQAREG